MGYRKWKELGTDGRVFYPWGIASGVAKSKFLTAKTFEHIGFERPGC